MIIAALVFCRESPDYEIIRFDGKPFVFEGLGASAYLHDDENMAVIDGLRLRYIRIEPSPNWAYYGGNIPSAMSMDEFRAFAAKKFEGDWRNYARRLEGFHRALSGRGIRVVWVMYQLPFKWLNGEERNRLAPAHQGDFLKMWLSQLLYYRSKGITPYAVELANEPDGWWNGRMPAEDYHYLVTEFRRLLNEHGFRGVKIGGPGLSSLNLYHDNQEWIGRMPDKAFAALDFFTMHGWDEVQHPKAGLNFMRDQWQPFKSAVARRDPTGSRRLIMTELSTEVTHFGEKRFYSPRSRALYSAMESPRYALRIVANTLLHMNHGVAVPMIWRMSDHPLDRTSWGLIAAKPRRYKRPAFFHLEKMMSSLIPGANIHPSNNQRNDHVVLLLSTRDNKQSLRAVNMNSATEKVKFRPRKPAAKCKCRAMVGKGTPSCSPRGDGVYELTIPARGGILCELR